MRATLTILLVLLVTANASATEYPEPTEIIRAEGEFVFTDGSSYYLFERHGKFTSEPLSLSGRVINGSWEFRDGVFVVHGRWSWINGLSPSDDYRQMKISVGRPTSAEMVDQLSLVSGKRNARVYQCYFIVEELFKLSWPPFDSN